MPKAYGNERVLSTPVPGPLLDEVKEMKKRQNMRLREVVVEALQLWLSTMKLLNGNEEDRQEERVKRLEDGQD